MHVLIVYESMYGNTHAIAESIAEGLRPAGEVRVVPVGDALPDLVEWADLLVVGGPTHIHGMTRASSRENARKRIAATETDLALDPAATGPGVREWLGTLPHVEDVPAAAFDTRVQARPLLTGRASGGIAKSLRNRGYRLVAEPASFLVDMETHLVTGELARARVWATGLVAELVPAG